VPNNALPIALLLVGAAISAVSMWPAFRGKEAAARGIGSHWMVAGAILTVLTLNVIFTLPFLGELRDQQPLTIRGFAIAALSTQIPILLVLYVRLIWARAVTWRDLGLRPLPIDRIVRVGLTMALLGLLATVTVELVLTQVGLRPNQFEQFTFIRGGGQQGLVVVLFLAAVSAPFAEELFFRGFIFGLYRRRQPLWLAYVVSGGLFAAAHVMPAHMSLAQMSGLAIGIFILGTLLAWTYQRTGSLYPGMLAHAVNNATGLLLLYSVDPR
jgi:uncharacterized protein